MGKMQKDIMEAEDHCKRLQKEFPWIATEQEFFGKPGSDYDFEAQDVQAAFQEYEAANQSLQRLANKVNRKVLTMFEKADAEYAELSGKKQILHMDKDKIQKVIGELDEKKREALHASWVKVNQDFGSVFSSLLPGTMAKLEPPEGQTFLAGLEVKVGFGDVWKQSLSELSGGQRSLLALSLILAMLLFKPAPIYILDEVDAALDLSHTQNIGRMIKTHFPYSQFIVVSLKEGMFNNANVIYRTKFVDGVSAVTRTVPDKR
ncbi:Structural maintenance of chromosomes protein 2-2 [Trebouxia sp. C0010 RCD-2024]